MKSRRRYGLPAIAFLVILLAASAWQVLQRGTPPGTPQQAPAPGAIGWEVYFSPNGGCTDAIIRALDGAREEIRVQAYSFTAAPIARALVAAHRRGVDVRVVLDDGQRTARYSEADFLAHMGVPTWLDDEHAIAHNKVMIIDRVTVITGSFNFSRAAEERNAENLLILHDPTLAKRYLENFDHHLEHSKRYAGR